MRFAASCLAVAASLVATIPAFAADAIYIAPTQPTAPATSFAPTDWSGVYLGAFGGYSFGRFADDNGNTLGADDFVLGGFGGVNFQNGDIVYGVEGDIGYSFIDAVAGNLLEQGVFGSLRGRIGYAFDPVLIYATAGVAATNLTVDTGGPQETNTHIGWTAGVGADVLLTENVFGRLEYRYSDYASQPYAVVGGERLSFDDHSIRLGIGFKF